MRQKFVLDECVTKNLCVGNSDFIQSVDPVGWERASSERPDIPRPWEKEDGDEYE